LSWRLTVRHGSEIKREQFESLDEAIAELQRTAEAIQDQGPLDEVKMIRTYEPERRVHARLEITGQGWIRRPEAGVDVMGDGRLVPYRGGIFKEQLEPGGGTTAYDAVRAVLGGDS
jgi:hypothetical protein